MSDQRWPPAHFLAGKVLPIPEAMALLAGASGLPVRVTVSWDRVARGAFLVPEAFSWTDDNSLTPGTQLQTPSAFPAYLWAPLCPSPVTYSHAQLETSNSPQELKLSLGGSLIAYFNTFHNQRLREAN